MFGNKELLARIEELEKRVKSLEGERELVWECVNAKYKNAEQILEKYVQKHIWYTNVENLEAYEKGRKIRVVLGEVDRIMGHGQQADYAAGATFTLGDAPKTTKSTSKKKTTAKKSAKKVGTTFEPYVPPTGLEGLN